jgi:hypothetical protein
VGGSTVKVEMAVLVHPSINPNIRAKGRSVRKDFKLHIIFSVRNEEEIELT